VQLVDQSELIAKCRREADMEGSDFISDAAIGDWLNDEHRVLQNLLLRHKGQAFFATRKTIATAGGSAFVNLPSDYFELLAARLVMSAGDERPLSQVQDSQIYAARSLGSGAPRLYRHAGMFAVDGAPAATEQLELFPKPNAVYSIDLDYVPAFRVVTSGTVQYNGINGWEMFMVYRVAARMLHKDGNDPKFCLGMAARIEEDIRALSAKRDQQPAVMVDVYGDEPRCRPWWDR
jgi:hypothetical protein